MQRSRSRHNVQMSKPSSQPQHSQPPQQQQYTPFSHPQLHPANQLHQSPQSIPQQPQSIAPHPPTITSQIMSHDPRPAAPTQIISAPFIDQSQYLTAIPVQPVIMPSTFPASATVISPLPQPPDYIHSNVVLTPAQNHIQDHLQRKHEELQKLIVQQQDELRRVSEQLFMARYGLLPSIVNVSHPFVAPIEQTDGIDSNRCISSTSHLSQQPAYQEHQSQMIQHHVLQASPQSQTNTQVQSSTLIHQSGMLQQQHMTISYDMNSQKQQQNHMEQSMESDASGSDIMQQYMQPSQTNMHQMQSHQQPMMNNNFELIPFQMMSQQAQTLFDSGNNNNNNNSVNASNNK